jgi:glutamyl-tRNA reductase
MIGARPLVVGANHRSASLSLRDALFVDDRATPQFLSLLGLPDASVISTCDRVEVWTLHEDPIAAQNRIVTALAQQGGMAEAELNEQLYSLFDQAAVRHCFAVTASLDSLVIGEPHVMGQVKACHRIAREAGLVGAELEGLFAAAYHAGKRVRSETAIAERPVSIASAAVQLAKDLHGELNACDALLVGAGDMGELVAEHLVAAGVKRLTVIAPKLRRAEILAQSLECHAAPFEQLNDLLPQADIVVTAVGARQTAISAEQVGVALKKRRRKPVFLVDTSIPGDTEPAANRLEGAFLYDLNDLETIAMQGRAERESAASQAFTIVDSCVAEFYQARAGRQAVPAIVLLRQHFEKLRKQAMAESANDAEKATRLLVNRLLHDPSEMMKLLAGDKNAWPAAEELLRQLFRLEG